MKFTLAALVAASASAMETYRAQFMSHIMEFGLSYGTVEEYEFRFEQFMRKQEHIEEQNASNSTYVAGHNKFSTWTQEEFERMLGYKPVDVEMPVAAYPENASYQPVDWVKAGKVSPVQDQGQCGSCWAFSTIASIESAHAIAEGISPPKKWSEQQLVDCVGFPCMGCNGGNFSWAFNKYLNIHALETETQYPYTAKTGSCAVPSISGSEDQGSVLVAQKNQDALKAQLAKGPVSVAIQANQLCFQTYTSGIFDNPKCGTNLDHAVVATGWGVENGQEYWIVRNSWGTGWGEQGYIRIAITSGDGLCGINDDAVQPTL